MPLGGALDCAVEMSRIWGVLVLCALGVSSAQGAESARLTADVRPGGSLRAGDITTLRFAVGLETEEMEVLLSLDGGRTFQLRVSREMSPGTNEIRWRVPNLPTAAARLALRARDRGDAEVIRAVSEEFAILPADAEPLEDLRRFRGEWRAGEALEEIPSGAAPDAPALGGEPESLRAVRGETDLDRTTYAAADRRSARDGRRESRAGAVPTDPGLRCCASALEPPQAGVGLLFDLRKRLVRGASRSRAARIRAIEAKKIEKEGSHETDISHPGRLDAGRSARGGAVAQQRGHAGGRDRSLGRRRARRRP